MNVYAQLRDKTNAGRQWALCSRVLESQSSWGSFQLHTFSLPFWASISFIRKMGIVVPALCILLAKIYRFTYKVLYSEWYRLKAVLPTCWVKWPLLRLGFGKAKQKDSFSLWLLCMHGLPQLGRGLHTSSDYVRSGVIWSPRWAVPMELLSNCICCSLLRGCLGQGRPPDKHLQWAPSRIDH